VTRRRRLLGHSPDRRRAHLAQGPQSAQKNLLLLPTSRLLLFRVIFDPAARHSRGIWLRKKRQSSRESIADWAQVTWPTISNFIFLSRSLALPVRARCQHTHTHRDESSRKNFRLDAATAFRQTLFSQTQFQHLTGHLTKLSVIVSMETFIRAPALFLLFVCTHHCEIDIYTNDALITAAHFLLRHAAIDCDCSQF
jgi:hypothetical protein